MTCVPRSWSLTFGSRISSFIPFEVRIVFFINIRTEGGEMRGEGGWMYVLVLKRTQVWFLGPSRQFTAICSSSSR